MQIESRLEQIICKYIVEVYLQNIRTPENFFKSSYNLYGCKFDDILNAPEICKDAVKTYIGREDDNIYISLSGSYLEPMTTYEDLHDEKSAWYKAFPHFNRIIQTLFFIKNLYDSGLIVIVKGGDDEMDGVVDDISKSLPFFFKHKSLLKFLEDSYCSEIIPTSELIALYNNDFKTQEQIHYEEQLKISAAALRRAKISNYIAILIGLLTLITSVIISNYVRTSIDDEQHKELIRTIENLHNE